MSTARPSDQLIALNAEIERTTTVLQDVSDELSRMAQELPWHASRYRFPLESLAHRLESAANGLATELRVGPDRESVHSHLRFARRAFALALAGLAGLAGGVAEGVGSEVVARIIGHNEAAEIQFEAVEGLGATIEYADSLTGIDQVADSPDVEGLDTAHDFNAEEAAYIVGTSDRQLTYWVETDVLPTLQGGREATTDSRYSMDDLYRLGAVKKMLDANYKLKRVRRFATLV